MAGLIPTPRSYQAIIGDMVATFLSRLGLTGMKVGGPILNILESAAQSDLRGSQDIFNLLDATDIDRATGAALDRKAADEDLARLPSTAASGALTVSDTSFIKVSSSIYGGTPAPNAGTTAINIADGSSFPATGSVYIGRNTINFEGPVSYVSVTKSGSYWIITLASATQKFHGANEAVTLAQGGNRLVPAGTVAQTAQGNVASAVSYTTLFDVTVPDGETVAAPVTAVCQQLGIIGNVIKGAINQFSAKPFVGASVTNALPLDNGIPAEDDSTLRERIKAARQSRALGTPLALTTHANGVQATDENKTVISSSVVQIQGEPAMLYIDDGTGYEEKNVGVALESLVVQALGGEQPFRLNGPLPVAKALAKSVSSAPFALSAGAQLAVKVAGVLSTHAFAATDFRSIANATAYEVVSSINGNPDLLFNSRTSDSGTKVVLFARAEVGEDIEVVEPDIGTDANIALGFPAGANYTLRLYRDDQLLFKDGRSAIVLTAPQSAWKTTIADGVLLKIKVDGTPARVYKIVDQDFVDAGTGFASVSASNSLDAWAAVLNTKVPGINATTSSNHLQLTSNRGASSDAGVVVSEPSAGDKDETGTVVSDATFNLVQQGMFASSTGLSSAGRSNDYTLNRNTGELKLSKPLAAGSSLSAGSIYTRAYVQGAMLSTATATIAAGGAKLWFAVDGAASVVTTSVTGSVVFNVTTPSTNVVRYTATPTAQYFKNLKIGDWVIVWDSGISAHGAWRVSAVDASFSWFEVERDSTVGIESGVSASENGIVFVRSASPLQLVKVAAGTNRSLISISNEMNAQLIGATASVFRNKQLRVTTDTYALTGDIFLAAADSEGRKLSLPRGKLVSNTSSHLAAVLSGTREGVVPHVFAVQAVTAVGQSGAFTVSTALQRRSMAAWVRRAGTVGVNAGTIAPIASFGALNVPDLGATAYSVATGGLSRSGSTVTVTTGSPHSFNVGDVVHVAPVSTTDANFAEGKKLVTAIPSSISFQYAESGSGVASTQPYTAAASVGRLVNDRMWEAAPYSIGSSDSLNVVLDNDTSKNYVIPLSRNVKGSGTYSSTGLVLVDADNSNQRLNIAFGQSDTNLFRHFALFMHARGKSHAAQSANIGILWRYKRMGSEGEYATVAYVNPTAPSQSMALFTTNDGNSNVQIRLPSDVARTALGLTATTRFTQAATTAGGVDTVVFTYSKPTVSLSRASDGVTVTGTTGSAHGFSAGDVVYIASTDANFPSGPKTITSAVDSTHFTYIEAGTASVTAAGQSCSSAAQDPNFANVVVGDIVTIGAGTAFATPNKGSWRVTAKTSTTFTVKMVGGTGVTAVTPASIGSADGLQFFPIKAANSKASDVVSFVNGLSTSPVTSVAIEDGGGAPGTGTISSATIDEYLAGTVNASGGQSVKSWTFADGLNFVQSSNLGANPNTFSLKFGVNSDLIANADFANEQMKLVPVTADRIAAYLSSPAVSSVYAGSSIAAAVDGTYLQLASTTVGSSGAVQVIGGTASAASASIIGTGSVVGSYSKVTVLDTQTTGLVGGAWCAVQASASVPKVVAFAATSTITVASAGTNLWKLTFGGAGSPTFWSRLTSQANTGDVWQVDRMGDFACYSRISGTGSLPSTPEGSWVQFSVSAANPNNNGTFRVVAVSADHLSFWVENSEAVEETVTIGASDKLYSFSYDSVMSGDTLVIDSNVLGASNKGSFLVVTAGNTGTLATNEIVVQGSMTAVSATTLGNEGAFFRVVEATPLRLIKQIRTIGQTAGNAPYSDVTFTTSALATKMSSANGCSIQPLSKLGFPSGLVTGADAYNYSAGLIGEVNRVIYGDPSNSAVYPGVVAAGAQVGISGPLVRRVQVAVAIRIRSGTVSDIISAVKSAIASAINQTKQSRPVAISTYIAAAEGVDGVEAVTPISPALTAGNDLIAIQPNEKARILDVDQDVLVSVVGS